MTKKEPVYGNSGWWYFDDDGLPHRTNGPAVLWNDGNWAWYLFGEWHRYYGPQDSSNGWRIHDEIVL